MERPKKEPEGVMITWLGEGDDGPNKNTWNGVTFKKGEAVKVTDEHMIEKAKTNRFYQVAGETSGPADAPRHAEPVDLDGMTVAELRELADQRGVKHDHLTKAELRDALRG